MVRGKRMAVDAAFIKANASMDSLVEKEVLEDASAFVNELEDNSEFKTTSTRKKLVERHHSWKEKEYKDMPGNIKNDKKDEDGKRRIVVGFNVKGRDVESVVTEIQKKLNDAKILQAGYYYTLSLIHI